MNPSHPSNDFTAEGAGQGLGGTWKRLALHLICMHSPQFHVAVQKSKKSDLKIFNGNMQREGSSFLGLEKPHLMLLKRGEKDAI